MHGGGRHRVGGGRLFGIALVVGLLARCGREEGGEALPFGAVEWRERRAVRPRERRRDWRPARDQMPQQRELGIDFLAAAPAVTIDAQEEEFVRRLDPKSVIDAARM